MPWLAVMVFALICTYTCGITFARSQSLDLQAKCASQAQKTFEEFESEDKDSLMGAITHEEFQSHYNTKLNRCLLLLTKTDAFTKPDIVVYSSWFLIDANERRKYASFVERGSSVVSCQLKPSVFQERPCKTREEFNAFVAPYMED
jgi:hypothetical protein